MILIRRQIIENELWFEIVQGPSQIQGVYMDLGILQALVERGVEVRDYDVVRREQQLWN